mgnify:CR=1 FL=1
MLKRHPVGEMDTEEDIETGLKSEGKLLQTYLKCHDVKVNR